MRGMGGGRKLLGLGLVISLVAGIAAGCGASSSSSGNRGANKGCGNGCANAGPASAPAPPGSGSNPAQLGCHAYCKQAGGYGGGGGPSPPPTMKILTSGALTPVNGVVPVTIRCTLPAPCRGAISIDLGTACSSPGQVGRSDLAVSANGTRTIGVPLSSCQQSRLRSRGQLKDVAITADSGQSPDCKQYDCVVFKAVTLRSSA